MAFRNGGLQLAPLGIHGLLAAGGGLTLLLCLNQYGAGVSADSVSYIAAARSLAGAGTAASYSGAPLTVWPPLYPLLLAAVERISQVDPLRSAGPVNAILFGLIAYLAGVLFHKHLAGLGLSLLGTAFVLVSSAILPTSMMAWSDPLFIVLTLTSLIYFERWLLQERLSDFLVMAAAAALACLTRYVGLALVVNGVLGIFLFSGTSLKARGKAAGLFAAIACLPLGLWGLRNWLVAGVVFGARAASHISWLTSADYALETLFAWYLPRQIVGHLSALVLLVAVVGFMAGMVYRRTTAAPPKQIQPGVRQLRVLGLFAMTYTALLITIAATTAIDEIDNRLMSPVLVPGTVVLFSLIESLTKPAAPGRFAAWVRPVLLAGIGLSFVQAAVAAAGFVERYWAEGGLQFNQRTWRESETIRYLGGPGAADLGCVLYSNGPDVLYLLASLPAKWSPSNGSKNLDHWPAVANACLVWLNNIHRDYERTPEDLSTIATLQPIIQFSDGAIYAIARK